MYHDLHLYFDSVSGEDILTDQYAVQFEQLNSIAMKYNGHWGDSGAAGMNSRSINFDFESDDVLKDMIRFLKDAVKAFPNRVQLPAETKKQLIELRDQK